MKLYFKDQKFNSGSEVNTANKFGTDRVVNWHRPLLLPSKRVSKAISSKSQNTVASIILFKSYLLLSIYNYLIPKTSITT